MSATVDINTYLARSYGSADERPCWLLVADYFAREHGLGVDEFKTVTPTVRAIATAFRLALDKGAHGFVQLHAPVDHAVVLLGRSARLGFHHCGVYLDGSVLHATETGAGGVRYQSLTTVLDAYRLVEYWARPQHIEASA